jgi:hypothetical protein
MSNCKISISVIVYCLVLSGCTSKSDVHKQALKNLALQYKAMPSTLLLDKSTYYLQVKLLDSNKLMCVSGKIKDLSRLDDENYLVKMRVSQHSTDIADNYLAEIKVNKTLFNKLNADIIANPSHSGAFVFKVSKILSFNGTETDNSSDEGSFDYDVSTMVFRGDLVDYILYDNDKKQR